MVTKGTKSMIPKFKEPHILENSISIYIDIETIGTAMDTMPWEIGAIFATHDDFQQLYPSMTVADISPNAKFTTGINIGNAEWDIDTYNWARPQAALIKRYVDYQNNPATPDIERALINLNTAIENYIIELDRNPIEMEIYVYSWGNFDVPILNYWYNKFKMKPLWNFQTEINLRGVALHTWKIGSSNSLMRPDTSKHEAIEDAFALMKVHSDLVFGI
jgi:3' exoribonuclease, RNase T-like